MNYWWDGGLGELEGLIRRFAPHPSGALRASSLSLSQKKWAHKGPISFLAGGEGFEPPLAESESAVLPLDDPPKRIVKTRLAFRELGCATCFTQTDFLTLYFT